MSDDAAKKVLERLWYEPGHIARSGGAAKMLAGLRKHPEMGQLEIGSVVTSFTGLEAVIVGFDYEAGTFTAKVRKP